MTPRDSVGRAPASVSAVLRPADVEPAPRRAPRPALLRPAGPGPARRAFQAAGLRPADTEPRTATAPVGTPPATDPRPEPGSTAGPADTEAAAAPQPEPGTTAGPADTEPVPATREPVPATREPVPAASEDEPTGPQPSTGLSTGPEQLSLGNSPHGTGLTLAATDPSRIEPTTGAPIAALPQRAPVRVPRMPSSPPGASGDGRAATLRTAVPQPPQTDVEPAIWQPIELVHWDGTPVDPEAEAAARQSARMRRPRRPRARRTPTSGLAGLLLLTLLASFFAWVSAEPLWIAVGHAERGTATVVNCAGSGIALRCRADFRAASGNFTTRDVRLTGVAVGHRGVGSEVAAHMIGAGGRTAYGDEGAGTLHLRWGLGLTLVLACVAGSVWATGALRLPDGRHRRGAWLAGLAGHVLITAGFLAAAF